MCIRKFINYINDSIIEVLNESNWEKKCIIVCLWNFDKKNKYLEI